MKRIRLGLVAALAVASLGVTAAPALSAECEPHPPACCPYDNPIDRLWVKLTGEHFFTCPM